LSSGTFANPESQKQDMLLRIKNMVCDRCKMVVKAELSTLGLHPSRVNLGEVIIDEKELERGQQEKLKTRLQLLGFELLEERKEKIVEQIKTAVIELIHRDNDDSRVKHSEYLAQQTGLDYSYLSKMFSDEEGITIEQYIIQQKIEKVKELLTYGEQTLSDIAYELGYSSVAALSSQFKKVMGITPSAWKMAGGEGRKTLDKVGK
jgi:AraC-like DNA-binding protein